MGGGFRLVNPITRGNSMDFYYRDKKLHDPTAVFVTPQFTPKKRMLRDIDSVRREIMENCGTGDFYVWCPPHASPLDKPQYAGSLDLTGKSVSFLDKLEESQSRTSQTQYIERHPLAGSYVILRESPREIKGQMMIPFSSPIIFEGDSYDCENAAGRSFALA